MEATTMSIFGTIMDKIFHRADAAQSEPGAQPSPQVAAAPAAAPASPVQAPAQSQAVDVEAVLTQLASERGGGNWRTSIVDLLKLLGLDSSLDARKRLADELGVQAGADGSAEQNIALHKAVMRKLAENGGKVPDDLKD
jgi:hypothetical protein